MTTQVFALANALAMNVDRAVRPHGCTAHIVDTGGGCTALEVRREGSGDTDDALIFTNGDSGAPLTGETPRHVWSSIVRWSEGPYGWGTDEVDLRETDHSTDDAVTADIRARSVEWASGSQ